MTAGLWTTQAMAFGLADIRTMQVFQRSIPTSSLYLFKSDSYGDESWTTTPKTSRAPQSPRPHHVQFASPLLDFGYPPTVEEFRNGRVSEKPILLYLPGFDGTYICPFIQYPELGTEFEVWCMTVGSGDRSTLDELKMCVLDFINTISAEQDLSIDTETRITDTATTTTTTTSAKTDQSFWTNLFSTFTNSNVAATGKANKTKKRPLYLVGESFGGILASEVALTILHQNEVDKRAINVDLQGLVLINPATCYDRSQLAAKGPPVSKLPPLLYPFGLMGLIPLFMDDYSLAQLFLILQANALPSVIDNPVREAFMGRVAFSLPTKLEYMNQGTLTWRLEEWLGVGCQRMESRIRDFQQYPAFRTLILVGEKDLTLPSIAEAERLVNLLPKCQVHVVEGAGHASTCGSRMDMTAQLRQTFPELRKNKSNQVRNGKGKNEDIPKRTAMKPEAANGSGPYFGMEPRYDGARIGLNPILYWTKENFQATQKIEQIRKVSMDQNVEPAVYTKIIYRDES